MLSLTVEKRDGKTAPEKLRESGKMPAVYYGPKQASTSVSLSMIEFKKAWKKAGESSVIVLKDGKDEHEALIHEVDVHPVSGEPRHADFYVIEKGKKVQVAVPIVFVGISPAVKDKGAILVKVVREIEVEAAPKDLPREISVDISSLVEFADAIHAKDIKAPAGVEFKINPEDIIASVKEAKEEVVEAPAAIDMAAIEVTDGKGKEVKEGEAGAAGAPAGEAGKGGKAADSKGGKPAEAKGADAKKGGDKK
jgi:large subunit ribosomal protein L25